MALNPTSAASSIANAYRYAAAIGADGKPTGNPPSGNFAASFASAYHSYASAGMVLGATSGGGSASIIESFVASADSNTPAAVTGFASALANYWAAVAITPGVPAHGGVSVQSVVNDASSKVSLFESAINASVTETLSEPPFLDLITNIENTAVSAIIWTVTEVMSNGAVVPFPEAIA